MGNGSSSAKRNTMTAQGAALFVGMNRDHPVIVGKAAGAPPGADAAVVAFILINCYPTHGFLLFICV